MAGKPLEKEDQEAAAQAEKQEKLLYACLACRATFKDPGMCPDCDAVLKKKAG
ncbi:MAG: hypothetical protein HY369_03405 [Candidatus Aenigmarchaeota archaeon]|nr:hypothetical protein [Candidatus Aenigmarchaeota archaeon]